MSAGIGLKPAHYRPALACRERGFWVEVHPENYMTPGGPRHGWLTAIRMAHPLSFHGVGLSLGGRDRPDLDHLRALKALIERYQPAMMSEHLAWCSHDGEHFADLLPLPYTRQTLQRFCEHVSEAQDFLQRPILIENPALYVSLRSDMSEAEFLCEAVQRTGCGLLVDINNIHVTANNTGSDPLAFLAALPADAVGQYHLAGHAPDANPTGLLIDTHGAPVDEAVWQLFSSALAIIGPRPVLIERDNDLPEFGVLMAERKRANALIAATRDASSAYSVAHG